MALCTWFCLHTVGPVRQIQMYDAIHVVTPPPQPHPAGKGWCAAAAALLHLDADSPTSCGDDLTLLCALLFWSNIPYYSRRHGGEVMPGGVQASAQDARYIALTSHVSGKFKWGTGECVFFGLPHNDNWYMRNRVIHIALFCSRFNKRASFFFFFKSQAWMLLRRVMGRGGGCCGI